MTFRAEHIYWNKPWIKFAIEYEAIYAAIDVYKPVKFSHAGEKLIHILRKYKTMRSKFNRIM